jgi:hypothetical protein
MKLNQLFLYLLLCFSISAEEFKSTLFKKGKLIYSDNFNEVHQQDQLRWGPNKGTRVIQDGIMSIKPQFTDKEEAIKKLKRDHHLGLGIVAHLNKLPKKFVCHLRYKVVTPKVVPGRPSFQIGHHKMSLGYLEGGGHRFKLTKGSSFTHPESKMNINEWVEIIIEYQEGKVLVQVNDFSKIYEDEKASMQESDRFTFKSRDHADERLLFDYVRLWEVLE